jgi:hypothetical protein
MSRKKAKKAVRKKVGAIEVRRVLAAFGDVFPVEVAQKGFPSWPFPARPAEDEISPTVGGSGNHEDGDIRSDEEDFEDIDADLKDLVLAKRSKALPVALDFGESKVTANLIREYEAAGFFLAVTGRAPLDEQTPTP